MDDVELWIDPSSGGRITPEALLHSEGTIEIGICSELFESDVVFFHIAGFGFCFGMGFKDGDLMVQYREHCLSIGPDFLELDPSARHLCMSWTPSRLSFHIGRLGATNPHHEEVSFHTHTAPPPELIAWVRKHSLLPSEVFPSEQAFVERVHSAISGLQAKVDEMSNIMVFWDVVYQGNRIVRRSPKNEVNLLPVLHAMLSDHMFLAGIEVYPEKQSGRGRLDFLFIGRLSDASTVKLCAEFKLAHSKDLGYGVRTQLPEYMRSNGTTNGSYVVLDFRGDWFSQPALSESELGSLLHSASSSMQSPTHPIKMHRINLGRSAPSRRA